MSIINSDADGIRVIAKMIDLEGYKDSARTLYDIADRLAALPHLRAGDREEIARVEVVECVQLEGLNPNAPAPDMYRVIINDGEAERCFDFDTRVTADILARAVNAVALPAVQGEVPDGWQLVPKEPSEADLDRMYAALDDDGWQAMLATAPAPPVAKPKE